MGVAIHNSHKATSITKSVITFENDSSSGPFDLIIDASGARSALRDLYAKGKTNRPYDYGALWSTVSLSGSHFPLDQLTQKYKGAHHMIGVLPVGQINGEKRAAFFWSLKAPTTNNSQFCPLWASNCAASSKKKLTTVFG
jgi:2-polyprenyl-6-methoxyphenol hydroxylase-like FAD-dependent oxidoreductase